jgi:hypothetical protein
MECRDCGLTLDAFGICPQAEPELARRTCSPIYCGKSLETHSKEALAQAIAALSQVQNTRQPAVDTWMRGTGRAH